MSVFVERRRTAEGLWTGTSHKNGRLLSMLRSWQVRESLLFHSGNLNKAEVKCAEGGGQKTEPDHSPNTDERDLLAQPR